MMISILVFMKKGEKIAVIWKHVQIHELKAKNIFKNFMECCGITGFVIRPRQCPSCHIIFPHNIPF